MSDDSGKGIITDVLVVAALLANLWLTARRGDDSEAAASGSAIGRAPGNEGGEMR
jgi:hypothetical protein